MARILVIDDHPQRGALVEPGRREDDYDVHLVDDGVGTNGKLLLVRSRKVATKPPRPVRCAGQRVMTTSFPVTAPDSMSRCASAMSSRA